MKTCPEYFLLSDTMYRTKDIVMLSLHGGVNGYGCWGKIQMEGMPEPIIIGDGSYYNDGSHVHHERASEFNFTVLRHIMRRLLEKDINIDDFSGDDSTRKPLFHIEDK